MNKKLRVALSPRRRYANTVYATDEDGQILTRKDGRKINLTFELRPHTCFYCKEVTVGKAKMTTIKTHLKM
jgi:hypothetical protein